MRRRDAKPLFIVTAIVEAATGVGLLAAPAMVLTLLFGLERVSVETSLVGRIAGAALTAIAIAGWMARADAFTPAERGLLSGLFIYNAVVCALFAFAASVLQMSGVLS
jgi:hypothetical protein